MSCSPAACLASHASHFSKKILQATQSNSSKKKIESAYLVNSSEQTEHPTGAANKRRKPSAFPLLSQVSPVSHRQLCTFPCSVVLSKVLVKDQLRESL